MKNENNDNVLSKGNSDLAEYKDILIIYILPKVEFFCRQFSIRGAFTGGEIHFHWWGIQKGWWGFSPPVY